MFGVFKRKTPSMTVFKKVKKTKINEARVGDIGYIMVKPHDRIYCYYGKILKMDNGIMQVLCYLQDEAGNHRDSMITKRFVRCNKNPTAYTKPMRMSDVLEFHFVETENKSV